MKNVIKVDVSNMSLQEAKRAVARAREEVRMSGSRSMSCGMGIQSNSNSTGPYRTPYDKQETESYEEPPYLITKYKYTSGSGEPSTYRLVMTKHAPGSNAKKIVVERMHTDNLGGESWTEVHDFIKDELVERALIDALARKI